MFEFLHRKRQRDVKRMLQGRINRTVARQLHDRARRGTRCAVCEVAWIIPCGEKPSRPQFEEVYAAVTRDISEEGVSFIHAEPVTDEWLLVGLQGDVETFFLLGTVEHCTPLGHGYYQVGMKPTETIDVEPHVAKRMRARLDVHESEPVGAEA